MLNGEIFHPNTKRAPHTLQKASGTLKGLKLKLGICSRGGNLIIEHFKSNEITVRVFQK